LPQKNGTTDKTRRYPVNKPFPEPQTVKEADRLNRTLSREASRCRKAISSSLQMVESLKAAREAAEWLIRQRMRAI
jgi:hypothetical protein